jgi:[ribosomal protein S5]-alanine N-acetyltransferase
MALGLIRMEPFPRLETERLVLREIVEDDAAPLLRVFGDEEHMKWFGSDPITSLEGARSLITAFAGWRALPSPGVRWGLETKDRSVLVGTCGLFAWNRSWKKCTLGYELAPEAAGRGLMREALECVISWGFEHMALNRIEALVHLKNTPSLALLDRLGFVHEGCLREVGFWAGHHHDLQQYSLLASDRRGASSIEA